MFWDINDDFCMYMLAGFIKMLYLCTVNLRRGMSDIIGGG